MITADSIGTFKVWDVRNFSCTQTFFGNDTNQYGDHKSALPGEEGEDFANLTGFDIDPVHNRIVTARPSLVLYALAIDPYAPPAIDPICTSH